MSETLRVYNDFSKRRRRSKSGFLGFLLKIISLLLLISFIYFFWITRDLYPVEWFIPEKPAIQIFSPRLMQNYSTIINSPLWELVDPSLSVYKIKERISKQEIVPLWVIKHLIYDFFYFSANDLSSFHDALFIVRLSRIGCVLEVLYSWTQPVEIDWAGGLNLKYIPAQKLYYVRIGRVLLISPSRETLIQCITQKGDTKTETILAKELLYNQEKHLVWGTVSPEQIKFKELLSPIHFYLALNPNQIGLKCETQIVPDPETPWTVLLTEIISSPIQEPPDTLISCSLDTGVPIKTWLRAFETIPQTSIILPSGNPEEIPFMEWVKNFAPLVDNQFFIAMDTFYTDEIIPFIPKYCVVAKTRPNMCENIIQNIINPTIIILGEKNKALPSAQGNEFIVPLIGSSQTDLHIQCSNDKMVFSNNPDLQNKVMGYIESKTVEPENKYSLILQIKPAQCITELNNAIKVLVDSRVLQFREPEKIDRLFNKIKIFNEVKVKIYLNKGQLKITGIAQLSDKSPLIR